MPASLDGVRRHLREIFGFESFRPGQEDIIAAIVAGRDVLAIMPTGAGKSLCYQLPALVADGPTVVVSPLIALMRDQVAQLRTLGIAAGCLNSSNTPEENQAVRDGLMDGSLTLVYAAPERLAREETVSLLRGAGVVRLAIDEAHCVSQWGHAFRPEYLALGSIREALGGVQTVAFTATADAATRADVAQRLFPAPPQEFIGGFDRPNLHLAMRPKASAKKQVSAFIARQGGQSGIVYCATRARTEDFAAALSAEGYRALPYHAGLDAEVRERNQDIFQREDGVIMAATVAFGMGIDKPDVRFVCHADMPKSIEAYYQEIGRAGRDGLPARTLTLYGMDDVRLARQRIVDSQAPETQQRVEHQRLNALLALCEAPRCRRQTLLAYFGETTEPCGHCDLCETGVSLYDGTIDAQKLMSAMVRTGQCFGTEHLINILTGTDNDAVRQRGHDRLPTFGVGKDRNREAWRAILRQIYAAGLVEMDVGGYGSWRLTDRGAQVLKGRESIELRADALTARGKRDKGEVGKGAASVPAAALSEADYALFEHLRSVRRSLAEADGVPAYVVFPDRTLIDMAQRRPATLDAMAQVHGVGQAKLERFGAAFLQAVKGGPG